MAELIVLSHYEATPLLAAIQARRRHVTISLDLGRSKTQVDIGSEHVTFADGQQLSWDAIKRIAKSENQCFIVSEGMARAIQLFSETTDWPRSLYPTPGAPTTLVAGFPMYRVKDTDPPEDTRKKIDTLAPVVGAVLDIATGLGYTAIEAAKTANHVATIECDPSAFEHARLNAVRASSSTTRSSRCW